MRIQESLIETINGVKDQPGFEFYWKSRKSIFFPEFQDYIDQVLETHRRASKGLYKSVGKQKLDSIN